MRKKLTLAAVVFVLIGLGTAIWREFNKARLIVEAEAGSKIYLATERGGQFTEIGETKAEFSSDKNQDVYVKVAKDNRATIKSAGLERSETVSLNLTLAPTQPTSRIATGALSFLHFEKDFVYGINPNTKALDYSNLGDKKFTDLLYLDLPFVRKVSWINKDNFIYATFGTGIGRVKNGAVKSIASPLNQTSSSYLDFSQYDGKPAVLLATTGLYLLDQPFDARPKNIVSVQITGEPGLYTDNRYIYFTNREFEEPDDEGDSPVVVGSFLSVYDYEGSQKYSFELPQNQSFAKVVDAGTSFAALGGESLVMIDKDSGDLSETSYYFSQVNDILMTSSGQLLLLGTDGLWRYDSERSEFRLLSPLPQGEEYVADSLGLAADKKSLHYSTKISRDALTNSTPGVNSSIYRIDLE